MNYLLTVIILQQFQIYSIKHNLQPHAYTYVGRELKAILSQFFYRYFVFFSLKYLKVVYRLLLVFLSM